MNTQLTTKQFFAQDAIKAHVQNIIKDKPDLFITSVLSLVNSSPQLQKCEPSTVYQAALLATTLNLPINQNLGFAYIIPYGNKAQFQIGFKGFIQLAQRSGQFLKIGAAPICEGQIIKNNPLTGYEFDFDIQSDKLIGYAAYFKLLNGYEATLYMSNEELTAHGKKYSKTFAKGFGLWTTDFEAMARKTVIKLLLQRFAPMSTEMQTAEVADQGVVNDYETMDVSHIDNTPASIEEVDSQKEKARISEFIENSKNAKELSQVVDVVSGYDLQDEFDAKLKSFKKS